MGRRRKPIEHHRRTGRANGTKKANGDALPDRATVASLPMAEGVPDPPADLGLEGRALWERAWAQAITWLSPASDRDAIEEAARLADDLSMARRRYRATSDPSDARAVVGLSKEFTTALSRLGFTPTARAALGVAEVKKASALDDLIARRANRKA